MVICLDKDTLSCVTCRRKIERALWVIWIEFGFSEEFCDVGLLCIIYTRKSGLPVRDRIFENFWKSKYRPKFLIWFLGITQQRVSLEKLWTIRKNWSCPEILDGYRKSLLKDVANVPTRSQSILFKLENILQELTVESETGGGPGPCSPGKVWNLGPLNGKKCITNFAKLMFSVSKSMTLPWLSKI